MIRLTLILVGLYLSLGATLHTGRFFACESKPMSVRDRLVDIVVLPILIVLVVIFFVGFFLSGLALESLKGINRKLAKN